jgi:hypothetical protein
MGDRIEDRLLAAMREISNAQTREILDFLRTATAMSASKRRSSAPRTRARARAKVTRNEAAATRPRRRQDDLHRKF